MTKPRPLGRRQVDVLRAAAKDFGLIRFDDGGWATDGHACTQPARTVAHLLADGKRGAVVTGGSWTSRPGTWMGLTDAGRAALAAYDAAHRQEVDARQRRTDAIARLAAKRGPITGDDLLRLAASDEQVSDDTFRVLGRAVDGRDITTGD